MKKPRYLSNNAAGEQTMFALDYRPNGQGEQTMSDTKHTPGPWRWTRRGPVSQLSGGEEGKSFSVVTIVDTDGHRAPVPEDAALIAAAPDLLEIAKESHNLLKGRCRCHPESGCVYAALREKTRIILKKAGASQ